jgi:hypothetical protein
MSSWTDLKSEMEEFLKGMGAEPVSKEELTFRRRSREQSETPPTKRDGKRKHHVHHWRGGGQFDVVKAIYDTEWEATTVRFDPKRLTRSPEGPRREPATDTQNRGGRAC